MSYGWTLIRKNGEEREEIRTNATCGDHCKEIARKTRKNNPYKTGEFIILDPVGNPYMESVSGNSWRMRWVRL